MTVNQPPTHIRDRLRAKRPSTALYRAMIEEPQSDPGIRTSSINPACPNSQPVLPPERAPRQAPQQPREDSLAIRHILPLINPFVLWSVLITGLAILFRSYSTQMTALFSPTSIPPQTGKTILVTGATAGLGKQSVTALAATSPSRIFLSGRNAASAASTISELKAKYPAVDLQFLQMDLTSLESVQAGARKVLETCTQLDTVVLNAGIMATGPGLSKDGYEVQWAANVMGHALLVKQLLPLLESTADQGRDVRVISLTSTGAQMAFGMGSHDGIGYDTLHSEQRWLGLGVPGGPWARYAQSKLGNMLYAQALAKYHPKITSVSIHPGVIKTGLFGGMTTCARPLGFVITTLYKATPIEQGWWNQVWAATSPKSELKNGEYYEPVGQIGKRPAVMKDSDGSRSDELWSWLNNELKEYN